MAHVIEKAMFWNIFKSVKFAVFLLITLAIAAVVGTIIPQGEESIQFAMRLKPSTFRILSLLGLFDVYHTLWFRSILALLALNLIVCSLDRIPKTWKRIRSTSQVDMDEVFKKEKAFFIKLKGNMAFFVKQTEALLKRQFKTIRSKSSNNKCFFYVEEGRYSQFGVYMVHLSIIIILFGGIIGSIWGFKGYINILEGEKNNTVTLNRHMKPFKLDFEIRCDKFLVDFYKNGTPKEYISKLTFIVDGKEVLKKDLRVNHPIHFQGITFYQSSYGISLGNKVYIRVINNESKQHKDIVLKVGEPYAIAKGTIKVVDIRKNLLGAGPAVFLSIMPKKGKKIKLVIFKDMEKAKKDFQNQCLMPLCLIHLPLNHTHLYLKM